MRGLIIVCLIVGAVGYVAVSFGKVKTGQVDFERVVGQRLEMVERHNADAVRSRLVEDARKYGFDLNPSHVLIDYRRTSDQTYAQGFLGNVAEFENWRASIELEYTSYLVGFAMRRQVAVSAVRQVQVRQRIRPELEQMLKDD
jgi:lipopolysaccharide assembly outer membrane protein LptD (OstA)